MTSHENIDAIPNVNKIHQNSLCHFSFSFISLLFTSHPEKNETDEDRTAYVQPSTRSVAGPFKDHRAQSVPPITITAPQIWSKRTSKKGSGIAMRAQKTLSAAVIG